MPKVAKRLKNLLFLQQTLVAKYYLFWISDKFPSGVGGGGGGGGVIQIQILFCGNTNGLKDKKQC